MSGTGPADDGETPGTPAFHYNREHRLARAPEEVRRAYHEGYTPNKGFLKGLTGNPGSRSMFVSIIILSAIVMFMTLFGQKENTGKADGVGLSLKAFLYGESVYVTIYLTPGDGVLAGPVPVQAVLTGLDKDGSAVAVANASAVWGGKEVALRATLGDYELRKVRADVSLGKTTVKLLATVDRK